MVITVIITTVFIPQTTLCNTALDNPTQRNKMQLIRAAVKFLETDTVWYEMGTRWHRGKVVLSQGRFWKGGWTK